MSKYDEFYSILELLEKEPNITPTAILYPFDRNDVYNTILNRLAQPLPDGSPSPFFDQNPLSAEGQLMAHVVYLQELLANEINLIPDNIFYTFFRLLGLLSNSASYPVVNVEFTCVEPLPIPFFAIPVGTVFRSQIDDSYISTRDSILFKNTDSNFTRVITARYSVIGSLTRSLRENEFNVIPGDLSFLKSVRIAGIAEQGRSLETLSALMYRARAEIRRPGDRVITARDYDDKAKQLGASKVGILPRQQIKSDYSGAYYDDLITILVYPESVVPTLTDALASVIPLGTRYDVKAPQIILVEGTITLVVSRQASVDTIFDLAATAIQGEINPPNGSWGETRLDIKIVSAIRRNALDPSTRNTVIFDVKDVKLTEVGTGRDIDSITIHPWTLFEIQDSLEFNYRFI